MQINRDTYTRHALERSTFRSIPLGVIEFILSYGDSTKGRDGAEKYCLSKSSLRGLKRDYGRDVASALSGYRNVYVVVSDGRIITAARSKKPLLH